MQRLKQKNPNYSHYKDVKETVGDVRDEIIAAEVKLGQYFTLRSIIKTKLEENEEDKRDDILNAVDSPQATLSTLGKRILDEMDGAQLMEEMDHLNRSIEEFIRDKIDKAIYQRQGNQQENIIMGFNQAFSALVSAYEALDDEHTLKANEALFGSATATTEKADLYQTSLYKSLPTAKAVFLVQCSNPSGRCYGYYDTADEHKKICPHKHGMDGETDKVWWSCFRSSCTYSNQHWRECRALCGEFFPPPTVVSNNPHAGYIEVEWHDHEVTCQVPVYKNFIVGRQPCGRKYFTCQVGCRHGVEEGYFSNSTSFSAYGTYRAEVVYNDPIKEVYWYFQKPGGSMKQVSHDTSGGKTSSWSHTFGSTSGTYKVKAKVYFKGSRSAITHERKVYVY